MPDLSNMDPLKSFHTEQRIRHLRISHMTTTSHKPRPLSRHWQALSNAVVFDSSLFILLALGCVKCVLDDWKKGGGTHSWVACPDWLVLLCQVSFGFQHLNLPCCLPAVGVYSARPSESTSHMITWLIDELGTTAARCRSSDLVTACFYFEGDEDKNSYRKILKIIWMLCGTFPECTRALREFCFSDWFQVSGLISWSQLYLQPSSLLLSHSHMR